MFKNIKPNQEVWYKSVPPPIYNNASIRVSLPLYTLNTLRRTLLPPLKLSPSLSRTPSLTSFYGCARIASVRPARYIRTWTYSTSHGSRRLAIARSIRWWGVKCMRHIGLFMYRAFADTDQSISFLSMYLPIVFPQTLPRISLSCLPFASLCLESTSTG